MSGERPKTGRPTDSESGTVSPLAAGQRLKYGRLPTPDKGKVPYANCREELAGLCLGEKVAIATRTEAEAFEAVQPALPGAAVGLDPLARLAERRGRAGPALARPAHFLGLDEAGELEDPHVLLDPVESQARPQRELAQRRGAAAQALEDAAPSGVREREEGHVEIWQ